MIAKPILGAVSRVESPFFETLTVKERWFDESTAIFCATADSASASHAEPSSSTYDCTAPTTSCALARSPGSSVTCISRSGAAGGVVDVPWPGLGGEVGAAASGEAAGSDGRTAFGAQVKAIS